MKRSHRALGISAALGTAALLIGSVGAANGGHHGDHHNNGGNDKDLGFSKGDVSKGKMQVPLYPGVAVPLEYSTIGGVCGKQVDLKIDWSEDDNEVNIKLRGKDVLERFPDYDRTEGVDFVQNPFWIDVEDVEDGRYQLWFISPGGTITLYYDPMTLDFIGSEYDFETPPPAIPIQLPALKAVPTDFFQPKANGNLNVDFTFPYDKISRGDNPSEWGHHLFTVAPINLCLTNPFRVDLTSYRVYMTSALPIEEAVGWDEYFRNGLIFDLTIEPAVSAEIPPKTQKVAAYSNALVFGGVVPAGYTMDFNAVLGGVAPAIKPWENPDPCADWYKEPNLPGINFCPPM